MIRDLEHNMQRTTLLDDIFKYLKMFGMLLLIFYHIYPQALAIGSSTFIVPSAVLGLGLYVYNKFPFVEIHKVVFAFLLFLLWCNIAEHRHGGYGNFQMSYIRSQMAWLFSAYLLNWLLFNLHKNPRFEVMVGYMAGTVILQSIITIFINQDEAANEFFYSLQMQTGLYTEESKEIIEDHRLIGYGTALFGAGMVAGYGLIMISYLISVLKLNIYQLILMGGAYAMVFFIGLFCARTTTIGLAISIGFLFLMYFVNKDTDKAQIKRFIFMGFLMFFIGATLCAIYFEEYTEWAFEMFDNFQKTGKFSTDSSDALYHLFYLPETFQGILFGERDMEEWGNDMGYTRLIYYIGFVGTIFFFAYQIFIAVQMMTKDLAVNLLLWTIIAYSLVLNVKGFTDLNPFLYLFLMFFMFHKYYRYYPNLYRTHLQQKREQKEKELTSSNNNINE